MSTHEQHHHQEAYQGHLGPAELTQFPAEDGSVQLVERYTQPGLVVDWEAHPATSVGAREAMKEAGVEGDIPRALIKDDWNNYYYLRGDTLYDMRASKESGYRIGFTLRDGRMPSVKIGERSPFSGGAELTEVLIPAGRVSQDESRARKAKPHPAGDTNLFDEYEGALAKLAPPPDEKARRPRASRGPLVTTGAFKDVELQSFKHTWRVDDVKPGRVTNLPEGSRWKAIDDERRPQSRHGEDISPGPAVKPPEPGDYADWLDSHPGKTMEDAIIAVDTAKSAQARKERRKPYEPRAYRTAAVLAALRNRMGLLFEDSAYPAPPKTPKAETKAPEKSAPATPTRTTRASRRRRS